ncbi:MAG: adenylate kinase [Pseudomonadota bacterium]
MSVDQGDLPVHIEQLRTAQRINVVGTSGTGKSTFARRLAELKGIPYIEMDQLYWLPDWQEPDDSAFFPKLEQALAGDAWVLDGNYHRSCPIKWPRTQVVVFLDLPFLQTIAQVTRRTIRRSRSRQELWPDTGNRETLRKGFLSSDSVIWWSITHHAKGRRRYLNPQLLDGYPSTRLIHLNSSARIEATLDGVATEDAP